MSDSPWFLNDRKPPSVISLAVDSGLLDITGLSTSDFTMLFINLSTEQERTGTGAFSNLAAGSGSTPASIVYSPSADDTSMLGTFARRIIKKQGTAEQQTWELPAWTVKR